jgi:hypothetical protein
VLTIAELQAALPANGAQQLAAATHAYADYQQAATAAATNDANAVAQTQENEAAGPSPPPPTLQALLQTLPQAQAQALGSLAQQDDQTLSNLVDADLADDQNALPAPGAAPTASSTDGLSTDAAQWISSAGGLPAGALLSELTPQQVSQLQQVAQSAAQQLQSQESGAEAAAATQAPAPGPSSSDNYGGLGASEWNAIQAIFKTDDVNVPTVNAFEKNLTPEQLQALQGMAQATAAAGQSVPQVAAAALQSSGLRATLAPSSA